MLNEKRTALVTGASRGIGRAIALRLARDGYDIAINFRENEKKAAEVLTEVKNIGRHAILLKADVSDSGQVDDMFEMAERELGEISLLVCNAGISGQAQIQDISEESWNRFFAVNVNGVFNSVKRAVPSMLSSHSGNIVIISSIWGIRGASCESAYSATKAALIGFSKSIANELAPSGIRVNCIAPGVIDTEMLDEFSDEDKCCLAAGTPIMRLGRPEEIASAVSFLVSDEASFITGQVLTCDGGFTV